VANSQADRTEDDARRRGRVRIVATIGTGGLLTVAAPLAAFIGMQPAEYGQFSLIYLVFGFGTSVQYSVVAEPWARALLMSGSSASRTSDYARALLVLSACFGAAALVVAIVIPELRALSPLLVVAVTLGIYRLGLRYRTAAEGRYERVAISDGLGIAAFAVALSVCLGASLEPLVAVSISWAVSVVSSCLAFARPVFSAGHGLIHWIRGHHRQIRPLLIDSVIMDIGAIGTPFALASVMPAHQFGVYRGVSNLAIPLRILGESLRPIMVGIPLRRVVGALALPIALASLLVGAITSAALYALSLVSVDLGTLSSLSSHYLAGGVFMVGSSVALVYNSLCRIHASGRAVFSGRLIQTVLVIAGPIAGFGSGGLDGAIWGFALSALAASLVWTYIAVRTVRRGGRSTPDVIAGSTATTET
jgi:hypothetical protein